MNMRSLGEFVSKKPVTTLIVMILLTSIFGFYASQMEMSADLSTFLPDDSIAKAQKKISEEFGDTDIVEVILISNNTVSKSSLMDMLKIEKALESNESVLKSLKTPENPGSSIMSPADVIITGRNTLDFEGKLIHVLENMSGNLSEVNFSAFNTPLSIMNSVMDDYRDIYYNATMIRDDAKDVVLLMFSVPTQNSGNISEFVPLLENVTAALLSGENFQVKSMFLTLLTPPIIEKNETSGGLNNPLLHFFNEDMNSSMPLSEKEVSVRYFIKAGNFSKLSMNYTNVSLAQGIEGDDGLLNALDYVNYSLSAGDNSTAMAILNNTIENMSYEIKGMSMVAPLYESYNSSLSSFLYGLNTGNLSPKDIVSVRENTSAILGVLNGEQKKMIEIFNDTLNEWQYHSHIYYDVAYEANATQYMCNGFLQSYESEVQLNNSLADVKMMINHDSLKNTTYVLSKIIDSVRNNKNYMIIEKQQVEGMLSTMSSPYFKWFNSVLSNMDYLLLHSNVALNTVNVYNYIMGMMNTASAPTGDSNFKAFYALKDAFESPVSDTYKYKIQSMYINEIALAYHLSGFNMNISFERPHLSTPDFNMSVDKKMQILQNMSEEDITETIHNIENYNSTVLTKTVNTTLDAVNCAAKSIKNIEENLDKILKNMKFIYVTTGEDSVLNSMGMYSNISASLENASVGLKTFTERVSYFGGFSYMMSKMSSQFKNMFSSDFNGKHASAALMLVTLNDNKLSGESSSEHSKRMEIAEETVENVANGVKIHGKVRVMGSYLISQATEKTSDETINVLLPVSFALVIIILLITFRNVLDTLLGIIGLGMAILWAYGFGVIMNYNFNQISTMVAVLLVGLGIDYAIHTILRYREELRKGKKVRIAMRDMITNLGMGLILATVTTIVSFLSNISSAIPSIKDFGVMNAVGIFGAFLIFTTFVPAVKILVDERREKKGKLKIGRDREREGSGVVILNRFMAIGAVGAEKHRYTVILVIVLITGLSVYAGMNVGTSFDLKDFLPSNLEITDTIQYMMEHFNTSGMSDNYILVEGNLTSPSTLTAVDQTVHNLKGDDYVNYAQTKSITTEIREWTEKNSTFAKMVSDNDTNGDGLPDKNITAVYNWLYQHGDGKSILHKSDGRYDSMIIIISSSASSNSENKVFVSEVHAAMKPLKEAGLKATLTGTNVLTFHILDMLTGSQWRSMFITIVTTLIVLTIVFYYESKSYVLGVIASLPVVIALGWLLGTMYLLNMSFNVVTVLTTSLTIGLGITYAIHITHRFLEDLRTEGTVEDAMRKTVLNTGSSIFGAATTTMAGFGTLMLSSMPPISQFGEVSALSILYSFVLSVFILPSFLYVWAEYRQRKIINKENEGKYRQLGVGLIFAGIGVYLFAFYLQWVGFKLPPGILTSPAFIFGALAALGTMVIIMGFEIYYRANGKL